ncbi:hypothetical protein [Kordiimonas gwangyangensis]|uniref:hypothetical protein n=1 Tax=Kordiimonas gwangyangensis TaxID=288022 RepID=UPI0003687646|nr:hypothetical protein [Kordiimonas gwangyangensis]
MWTVDGGATDDNLDIRITADGVPIERCTFCVPTMSIHQVSDGYLLKNFELTISVDNFAFLMDRTYADFVRDIREDDELTGEPFAELAAAGYPPTIRQLMEHPDALNTVMGDHLVTDLLSAVSLPEVKEPRHWYLTPRNGEHPTQCRLVGANIIFSGFCITRSVS